MKRLFIIFLLISLCLSGELYAIETKANLVHGTIGSNVIGSAETEDDTFTFVYGTNSNTFPTCTNTNPCKIAVWNASCGTKIQECANREYITIKTVATLTLTIKSRNADTPNCSSCAFAEGAFFQLMSSAGTYGEYQLSDQDLIDIAALSCPAYNLIGKSAANAWECKSALNVSSITSGVKYCDVTDGTKCLQYILTGITTATTRNVTWPNRAITVAGTSGTLTSGNCAEFDANGNLVDAGAACGVGGGEVKTTNFTAVCDGVHNYLATAALNATLPVPSSSQYCNIEARQASSNVAILPDSLSTTIYANGTNYGAGHIINATTKGQLRIYGISPSVWRLISDTSTLADGGLKSAVASDYSYVKCLNGNTTVTGANVATTQTNFPIAVHINSASWSAGDRTNLALAQTDGKRVSFFASNQTTVLPYEVEYYAETDNVVTEAVYWVKVGTITGNNTNSNMVCIAYGNQGAGDSDQSQKTDVWDSNFKMVQHLGDNSWLTSPEAKDSTVNANNGTNSTLGSTDATGQIRKGRYFDMSNDWIEFGDPASLESNYVTVSAWFNAELVDAGYLMITKGNNQTTPGPNGYWLKISDSGSKVDGYIIVNNGHYYCTGTTTLSIGTLYFGTFSYDGTNMKVYLNGTQENTTAISGVIDYVGTYQNAVIGGYNLNGNYIPGYKGILDEVRISSIARSADWIKLEHFSMKKTNWNGDGWITWN